MVRKIKVKEKKNIVDEISQEEIKFYSNQMDLLSKPQIEIPIKCDLMEPKLCNSFKLEQLTKRFEVRVTETEKEIIESLKSKNINVSEEVRKFILTLDPELAKEKIELNYLENFKKMQIIESELESMNNKYQDTFLENPGWNDIQEMVDRRYKIKFEIRELESELFQRKKYSNKYSSLFLNEKKTR